MASAALSVVPDLDEPGCAAVLVDVDLDGHRRSLVLDTGAPTTHVQLDEHTAAWPAVGRAHVSGLFGSSVEVDVVRATHLTVAGETVHDLPVQRGGVDPSSGHGVLGLDVLGRFACRLDLRAERLDLAASGAEPCPHQLERGPRGHLHVRVRWGRVVATALVDSGAEITLIDRDFAAGHPGLIEHRGTSAGIDSTGSSAAAPTVRLAPYTIGDATFAEHVAAVVPLPRVNGPIDLVLGYPTLVQARWLLDVPAGCFDVLPHRAGSVTS